jgi:hypothetical protein
MCKNLHFGILVPGLHQARSVRYCKVSTGARRHGMGVWWQPFTGCVEAGCGMELPHSQQVVCTGANCATAATTQYVVKVQTMPTCLH